MDLHIVTGELVGQRQVVRIRVGLPGDTRRAGRLGPDHGVGVASLDVGAHLVGSHRAHGEPHQALLADAVDRREFTAHDDVAAVAGDAPGRLGLPGVGPRLQVGEPVDHRRAGGAEPVEVVERIVLQRAGGVGGERQGSAHVRRPGNGLEEAAEVAAVVRMADGVDLGTVGVGVVGVPVAVLDPGDIPGGRVRGEGAFQVAAGAVVIGRSVHGRAVGGQAGDRGVRAGVADLGAGVPRHQCTGFRIDRGQAVGGRSVHVLERAADDDLAGRRLDHRVDVAVGSRGPPGGAAVGGAECGQLGTAEAAAGAEDAADVDRGVGRHDRVHRRVQIRREGVDDGARGGVVCRQAVVLDPVGGGESATDVDPRLVRRDRDDLGLGVQGRGDTGDQRAGRQVVGEQVVAGGQLGAGGGPGRAGVGELTAGPDGVADDGLVPHDPVDLGGRERIGGDRGRRRRDDGRDVGCCRGCGGRGHRESTDHQRAGRQDCSGPRAQVLGEPHWSTPVGTARKRIGSWSAGRCAHAMSPVKTTIGASTV